MIFYMENISNFILILIITLTIWSFVLSWIIKSALEKSKLNNIDASLEKILKELEELKQDR